MVHVLSLLLSRVFHSRKYPSKVGIWPKADALPLGAYSLVIGVLAANEVLAQSSPEDQPAVKI